MVNEGGQDLIRPTKEATSVKIDKVRTVDLKPEIPQVGGTVIVLQRNAKDKDNRKLPETDPNFGALDEGEAGKTRFEAKNYFRDIFKNMSDEERKTVDILVVAADTKLKLPDRRQGEHQRAVETGDAVIEGAKEVMDEFSIPQNQLLNKRGEPIELTSGRLRDLKMLDNSEFVDFLMQEHPDDFWTAYEGDIERETRMKMGAEGPLEIADRVNDYLKVVANAMRHYHERHPGRRAIVWAVSHYDSISPFLKKHVAGMDEKTFLDTYLPVDYRAGVVFNLGASGNATAGVAGKQYLVSLT